MGVYDNEMKNFFILNAGFKEIIENLSLVRNRRNGFFLSTKEEISIEYSDQMCTCLFYVIDKINITMHNFGFSAEIIEEIHKRMNEIISNFNQCSINLDALTKFYEEYILGLSQKACKKIDESLFPYIPQYEHNALEVAKECKTINDIVHFLHVCIVNDEKNYQNIPVLYGYESEENRVYLKGEVSEISRFLYKEYIENIRPMQCPVEILDIGNNILILAGSNDMTISFVIDLTTPRINVDFKIIGDISENQIKMLMQILYKNGAQNLSIKHLTNGISGLVICSAKDLANIVSSYDGLINFVTSDGGKVKKRKGEV